jgi:hypothetical protein
VIAAEITPFGDLPEEVDVAEVIAVLNRVRPPRALPVGSFLYSACTQQDEKRR